MSWLSINKPSHSSSYYYFSSCIPSGYFELIWIHVNNYCTLLLYNYITILLYNYITISLYIYITIQLYNNISQQYNMMTIYAQQIKGKSYEINIHPYATIQSLYDQVAKMTERKAQSFILVFSGRPLKMNEKKTLLSVGIQQYSTLHLMHRLSGGGCASIIFNSLTNPVIKKSGTIECKWRTLGFGLSLEGTCKNKNCQVYNEAVWTPKGYGKFNMTKEVNDSKCPMCNKTIADVYNMALYMGKIIAIGKVKGDEETRRMESIHKTQGQFLTFEDKDETRVEWLFLEMEVLKL